VPIIVVEPFLCGSFPLGSLDITQCLSRRGESTNELEPIGWHHRAHVSYRRYLLLAPIELISWMKIMWNKYRHHFLTMKKHAFGVLMPVLLLPGSALADLPRMEDPSRGKGNGIMGTIKNYGYDIVILMALGVCALGFLVVANSCISTYSEIQAGRKQWKDLGAMAGVGAVLLVVIIWLLTKATEIL